MITSDDILTIASNILVTTFELEAFPTQLDPSEKNADRITGCVPISGEWQGAVVVQSSERLAKTFASKFFETDADEVSEDDIRDAFAEVTNMIGGNIKGQVPCPSFLAIPSVTTGQDFEVHLSGTKVIEDLAIQCNGEQLRVMMFEVDRSKNNRMHPSLEEPILNAPVRI